MNQQYRIFIKLIFTIGFSLVTVGCQMFSPSNQIRQNTAVTPTTLIVRSSLSQAGNSNKEQLPKPVIRPTATSIPTITAVPQPTPLPTITPHPSNSNSELETANKFAATTAKPACAG